MRPMPHSPQERRRHEAMAADFDARVFEAILVRLRDSFADIDFWRRFAPEAAITDVPFSGAPARAIPENAVRECVATLGADGYFASPPLVDSSDAGQLIAIARRLSEHGYPVALAAVYDSFWRLFEGLDRLIAPMLGERYLIVPNTLWMYYLPPGSGVGGWSAGPPHRDAYGPDPHLLRTGMPGIINIWIALTDATPLNSCIYVLPAGVDDEYLTSRAVPANVSLPDVRALPAPAGSILGWTTHVLHWGSRSSAHAAAPRCSAAVYLQRRDISPYHPDVLEVGGHAPFARRLRWIAANMGVPHLFD
jgi:hypothetical protein